MLVTKCIRANVEPTDGLRISIMSRHTLNDGITPDNSIIDDMFDEWQPLFAPPSLLIGSYYLRGLSWPDFEEGFNTYLDRPSVSRSLQDVAELAMKQNVTLLCTEESPDHCHRRLVAERCQFIIPSLVTIIR